MRRRFYTAEQMPARFHEGTIARIDAALRRFEKRSEFIRTAVENELRTRAATAAAAAPIKPIKPIRLSRPAPAKNLFDSAKRRAAVKAKQKVAR